MRNIILFIIAILLPVFAFLNFTQKDDGNMPEPQKQVASISVVSEDDSGVVEVSDVQEDDGIEYKIPKVFYTEPTNFPNTAAITRAYIDRIKNPSFYPIRNWDVALQDINAISAISIEPIAQKILYNKNIFDPRPIASLSKLMAALIVVDEMNLGDEVLISKNAIEGYGDAGDLVVDEKLTVESLLYALLVSSSNDAAIALEEYYNAFRVEDDKTFVAAMNGKAHALGLIDTFFVEPSGLNINNRSTAYDLARLADYIFHIPALRQILSTPVIDVQSVDGVINHHLVNSNKLLGVLPGVLAGKTGYTDEAGESIVLFVKKGDDPDDYLIHLVLGSDDRIKDARALIDWVDKAYVWE